MRHVFHVPVVRQVALDKVLLRNGPISLNLKYVYIFSSENEQKCPNKMTA